MPLRSTVRKLSSNFAIDTPIFSASAGLAISTVIAAAYRIFFISSLLHRRCPVAPRSFRKLPFLAGESCEWSRAIWLLDRRAAHRAAPLPLAMTVRGADTLDESWQRS